MKKIIFAISLGLVFITLSFSSCGNEDMGPTKDYLQGLLSVSVNKVGDSQSYTPNNKGPYKTGDIIEINIPYREGTTLDLTRMNLVVSLENNCFINPKIPGIVNLSTPYTLSVTNSLGEKAEYTIKVNPVKIEKAIATFEKEWFKNANQLQLAFAEWASSIALNDNYLFIHDGVSSNANRNIRAYDLETGELKKTLSVGFQSFLCQIKTDDAGHLMISRFNIYGAGFMLYLYDNIDDSEPRLILNYTADAGCPVNLGIHFSVVGNIKEGKAYVYATSGTYFDVVDAQGSDAYYYWEFNDGIPTSVIPTKITFPKIGGTWTYAIPQRESVEDNSDIYLSYLVYSEGDASGVASGSHFYCINGGQINDIIELDKTNLEYKILGYTVFKMGNHRFLATLLKGFDNEATAFIKIFDITDKNNIKTMKPKMEGYDRFMLYVSDKYSNYQTNHWGDITVQKEGNNAYIYAIIPDITAANAGIMKYHMIYDAPENE